MSSLVVGHTKSQIDQMFSSERRAVRRKTIISMVDLVNVHLSGFKDDAVKPHAVMMESCLDWDTYFEGTFAVLSLSRRPAP